MTLGETRRFILAQVLLGSVLTLLLTWLSMAVADHIGTPDPARWIFSPGYLLGMHYAWGRSFREQLGQLSGNRPDREFELLRVCLLSFAKKNQLAEVAKKSAPSLLAGS